MFDRLCGTDKGMNNDATKKRVRVQTHHSNRTLADSDHCPRVLSTLSIDICLCINNTSKLTTVFYGTKGLFDKLNGDFVGFRAFARPKGLSGKNIRPNIPWALRAA